MEREAGSRSTDAMGDGNVAWGSDEAEAAPSRREFFGRVAGAAAAVALSKLTLASRAGRAQTQTPTQEGGVYAPLARAGLRRRRAQSYEGRVGRAGSWLDEPLHEHLANDDELIYPDVLGSFTKGLPHDSRGNVERAAFDQLVRAAETGSKQAFVEIPLGGAQPLRNPLAAYAFESTGYDSHASSIAPAPAFASAETAAEMVELYWAALLRDVPFSQYPQHPLAAQASAELSSLGGYRHLRPVTPANLFRGPYAGSRRGPMVSQFLLKDARMGAQIVTQRIRTLAPNTDYMTQYGEWLARQNGAAWGPRAYDPTRRYIRNGRDLAAWVDEDPPVQAALHALAILLDMDAPKDPRNPYKLGELNQEGFVTFGKLDFYDMIGRASFPAHKAAWFHKWCIHRRLRPEEFGGRVHNRLSGAATDAPIHRDVLESQAVRESFRRFGSHLLPQAYPDGCPVHPAYPGGHATGVGATVTMLKAMFDESFVIRNPVEPTPDGLSLRPYTGPALTVGGELDKLAWNVAFGRTFAGIHWRSDNVNGNLLGEAISVSILSDCHRTYREPFDGYRLTPFDGPLRPTRAPVGAPLISDANRDHVNVAIDTRPRPRRLQGELPR